MLHLHHLQNSRSFRIVWLLEELGLDYQLTHYERTKAYLAPKSLQRVHPMGKAPVLDDDGKALSESGFIIEYLLKHHDPQHRFKPRDDQEQAWEDYTFWMHYAEASAMPPLVMRLVFNKTVSRSPLVVRPISRRIQKQVEHNMISPNIQKMLTLMEQHLNTHQWFAGREFSAADIQMGFVVEAASSRTGLKSPKYANIMNWLKRCQSRPAYQRAVARGGELNF